MSVEGSDTTRPDLIEGTRRMLALRKERIGAGDDPIGWKLGFGAPASLERFRLAAPLVGFLTSSSLHRPGDLISCAGWKGAVAEPEMAVLIGSDLGPGDDVARVIAGIRPAIELADVDPPPEQISEILAGNIFHRAVVLGDASMSRAGSDLGGLEARVSKNGTEVARTTDLTALTGDMLEVVRHTADFLTGFGESLRAGDLVITGSIVPPLGIEPGDEVGFELAPVGTVTVRV